MFPEISVTKTTSPRQKPQPGQPGKPKDLDKLIAALDKI